MSHYFINDEKVKDQPFTFSFQIKEKKFEFESNQGVFSKDKLDEGTKILLNTVLEYYNFKCFNRDSTFFTWG